MSGCPTCGCELYQESGPCAGKDLLEASKLIYAQLYGPPMTWADQVLWQQAAEAIKAAIAKAENRNSTVAASSESAPK